MLQRKHGKVYLAKPRPPGGRGNKGHYSLLLILTKINFNNSFLRCANSFYLFICIYDHHLFTFYYYLFVPFFFLEFFPFFAIF